LILSRGFGEGLKILFDVKNYQLLHVIQWIPVPPSLGTSSAMKP